MQQFKPKNDVHYSDIFEDHNHKLEVFLERDAKPHPLKLPVVNSFKSLNGFLTLN